MVDFTKAERQSVQELAVQNLMTLLRNMEDEDTTVPNSDPPVLGKLWKSVFRGDPDDNPGWSTLQTPFVAVEDGDSTKIGDMMPPVSTKDLIILVHFRFQRGAQGDVDPFKVYNYYLARLQEAILTDYRLGGTIRDISETSAAPLIFREDNMQGGYLALLARFAHERANPYIVR